MNVQWEHDPVDKNKLTSVSVNILSKKDKINPLAYKLTIFISTGTIQVPGNDYNLFVSSHFKVIITLVNKLMGICENNKSESTDADQTIPKGFHDQEKPSTPSRIPVSDPLQPQYNPLQRLLQMSNLILNQILNILRQIFLKL